MNIPTETQNIIRLLNPWWTHDTYFTGTPRSTYKKEILDAISHKHVLFILGPRRVGKTTLIFQTILELITKQGVGAEKILFLSLDNPTLDILNLQDYIAVSKQFDYVFLDEVQYRKNWQIQLKALFDNPSRTYTMICSGSASSLISDTSSYLTGRSKRIIVNTLGYDEFQTFTHNSNVEQYLEMGGYPEYVLEKTPNYHAQLFRDVVLKDIVFQFNVSRSEYFYEIANLLAKQIGFGTSFSKLAHVTRITDDTVKTYIEYLSRAYVINSIQKYSQSLNDRIYSAKKFYFYDLGMRNSFVGFEDIGSLVENAVYLKLQQKFPLAQIFYLKAMRGEEIDFIMMEKYKATLIEVKYLGLKTAVLERVSPVFYKDIYDLEIVERIIVTKSVKGHEVINEKEVQLIPLTEFLS